MKVCKNCDTKHNDKFCKNCGQKAVVGELIMHEVYHETWILSPRSEKISLKI